VRYEDNYFDLLPGERARVKITIESKSRLPGNWVFELKGLNIESVVSQMG